ncbi:hypothetical protein HK096_003430 [Nowakowskiella sp. JEL0078]|nr:hypothetical protein HK096_003430 [Nowakowskiella sp. JEL0078]
MELTQKLEQIRYSHLSRDQRVPIRESTYSQKSDNSSPVSQSSMDRQEMNSLSRFSETSPNTASRSVSRTSSLGRTRTLYSEASTSKEELIQKKISNFDFSDIPETDRNIVANFVSYDPTQSMFIRNYPTHVSRSGSISSETTAYDSLGRVGSLRRKDSDSIIRKGVFDSLYTQGIQEKSGIDSSTRLGQFDSLGRDPAHSRMSSFNSDESTLTRVKKIEPESETPKPSANRRSKKSVIRIVPMKMGLDDVPKDSFNGFPKNQIQRNIAKSADTAHDNLQRESMGTYKKGTSILKKTESKYNMPLIMEDESSNVTSDALLQKKQSNDLRKSLISRRISEQFSNLEANENVEAKILGDVALSSHNAEKRISKRKTQRSSDLSKLDKLSSPISAKIVPPKNPQQANKFSKTLNRSIENSLENWLESASIQENRINSKEVNVKPSVTLMNNIGILQKRISFDIASPGTANSDILDVYLDMPADNTDQLPVTAPPVLQNFRSSPQLRNNNHNQNPYANVPKISPAPKQRTKKNLKRGSQISISSQTSSVLELETSDLTKSTEAPQITAPEQVSIIKETSQEKPTIQTSISDLSPTTLYNRNSLLSSANITPLVTRISHLGTSVTYPDASNTSSVINLNDLKNDPALEKVNVNGVSKATLFKTLLGIHKPLVKRVMFRKPRYQIKQIPAVQIPTILVTPEWKISKSLVFTVSWKLHHPIRIGKKLPKGRFTFINSEEKPFDKGEQLHSWSVKKLRVLQASLKLHRPLVKKKIVRTPRFIKIAKPLMNVEPRYIVRTNEDYEIYGDDFTVEMQKATINTKNLRRSIRSSFLMSAGIDRKSIFCDRMPSRARLARVRVKLFAPLKYDVRYSFSARTGPGRRFRKKFEYPETPIEIRNHAIHFPVPEKVAPVQTLTRELLPSTPTRSYGRTRETAIPVLSYDSESDSRKWKITEAMIQHSLDTLRRPLRGKGKPQKVIVSQRFKAPVLMAPPPKRRVNKTSDMTNTHSMILVESQTKETVSFSMKPCSPQRIYLATMRLHRPLIKQRNLRRTRFYIPNLIKATNSESNGNVISKMMLLLSTKRLYRLITSHKQIKKKRYEWI